METMEQLKVKLLDKMNKEFEKQKQNWINEFLDKNINMTEEQAEDYFLDEFSDFVNKTGRYELEPFTDCFDFYPPTTLY